MLMNQCVCECGYMCYVYVCTVCTSTELRVLMFARGRAVMRIAMPIVEVKLLVRMGVEWGQVFLRYHT